MTWLDRYTWKVFWKLDLVKTSRIFNSSFFLSSRNVFAVRIGIPKSKNEKWRTDWSFKWFLGDISRTKNEELALLFSFFEHCYETGKEWLIEMENEWEMSSEVLISHVWCFCRTMGCKAWAGVDGNECIINKEKSPPSGKNDSFAVFRQSCSILFANLELQEVCSFLSGFRVYLVDIRDSHESTEQDLARPGSPTRVVGYT